MSLVPTMAKRAAQCPDRGQLIFHIQVVNLGGAALRRRMNDWRRHSVGKPSRLRG